MAHDLAAQPFAIASKPDRFLFFDAFIRDHRLVLVSTYYPDVIFDFAQVEVTVDGEPLRRHEEIGLNEYEPTRAIVYPLGASASRTPHELVVRHEGQTRRFEIEPQPARPRREFAVATLFKDDFAEIQTFYRYYKQQGVDRFYLFYNGELAKVRAKLPDADDIVYGEWNFAYWLDTASEAFTSRLVDPQAARNKHHAQTAFLTMVRHRYLASCSFLALIDLDEFLAAPGETLRQHVERMNQPTLTAPCHWAEVRALPWLPPSWWQHRSLRIALALRSRVWGSVRRALGGRAALPSLALGDLRHVWANTRSEGSSRMKTIYRGDHAGLFGIHTPKPPASVAPSPDLKLYHIVNTGHGRQTRIHADAEPVSLLAGS